MPVQSPPTKKSSIVHRSESLRSEVSDASQQSKRVSFNRDVHVKRIPRGSAVVDRNGKLVAVLDGSGSGVVGVGGGFSSSSHNRNSDTSSPNGRLWVNSLVPSSETLPEEELLREAETILKHVDSVTCSTHTSGHYDTRSLERPKQRQFLTSSSSNGHSGSGVNGSGGKNSHHKTSKSFHVVQKSPSRLSDFFSKTLPSHLKNKYQQSKSTQNLTTISSSSSPPPTTNVNGNGVHKSAPKEILKHSGVSRQFSNNSSLNGSSSILLSKSEPNLYNGIPYSNGRSSNNGNGQQRYKKVAKIKKPHGSRVALNSISSTSGQSSSSGSSGSGSDNNSSSLPKIKVSTSDSPVSSLSGPEVEPSRGDIMANSLGRDYSSNNISNNHQNRVSSIVQQLSSRRGQESPERGLNPISSSFREPLLSSGNTHNNNQPFSYITGVVGNGNGNSGGPNSNHIERGRSPAKNLTTTTTTTTPSSREIGKSLPPLKEVIYAQVVCSGKEPGVPGEKRTIHTTVNGTTSVSPTTDSSRSSPSRNLTSSDTLNNNKNSSKSKENISESPHRIQHFVYEKEDKGKNKGSSKLVNGNMNNHSSFRTSGYHRPTYDDFDFSGAKPRNNVTTVLLNNVDDDDTSFSSSRNNSYNYNNNNNSSPSGGHYRNHSPSPSPSWRKPEQSFYFGSPSRLTNSNHHESHFNSNGHHHGPPYTSSSFNYKSPRIHDYPSSREVSPAAKAVSSALLVRDAERKKDSIVSSAKLVSTFGHHHHNNHINSSASRDYDYNHDKLETNSGSRESPSRIINHSNSTRITNGHNHHTSSLAKSRYGTPPSNLDNHHLHSNNHHQSDHLSSSRSNKKIKIVSGSKTSTPNASNTSVNKLGLRSKENSPTSYRDYTKSKSPDKSIINNSTLRRGGDSSLERKYNRKNKEEQQTTTITTNNTSSTGGTGLISTLMRRNKDKKIQKEAAKEKERKEMAESSPPEPPGSKENKIKRQRAKFLSAFLDKNFPSRNKNSEVTTPPATTTTTTTTAGTGVDKKILKNNKPTDSEIEEAERRRDGEYHSWSSGDEDYRFGHHRNGQQLTRGKSYNFGEFNEESGTKPWYDQNDSDYRREMATNPSSGNPYTSATLGNRQRMRSSGHDSDNLRSKSLDRRAYKNRTSPPRIMVTPNTPAVEETDKWKSTYDPIIRSFDRDRISTNHHPHHHHPTLSKKMSGLSKSSYELDDRGSSGGGGDRTGKLRYFGDTDAEDLNYQNGGPSSSYLGKNHHSGQHHSKFIPRSSSYLSRGSNSKYYTVPGSSLNSSGSENGSRMSKGSSNAGSHRSVYLHAPAVADIPPTGMQRRTLSRDELSNHSGSQKQTRHLARSMSVLAPWRPRHYREKYEVNYNNDGSQPYGRPPKPPRSPTRKSMSPSPGRAGSTESLLKSSDDKAQLKSSTLGGKNKENVKISRSKSMPKDTRLFAGWLRKRRFGKEAKS